MRDYVSEIAEYTEARQRRDELGITRALGLFDGENEGGRKMTETITCPKCGRQIPVWELEYPSSCPHKDSRLWMFCEFLKKKNEGVLKNEG
jgi:hypothetical protein